MNRADKPMPLYRIRRDRGGHSHCWTVSRWYGPGGARGTYLMTPPRYRYVASFHTWADAMADVSARLTRRPKT